jgi:hypothetical protein
MAEPGTIIRGSCLCRAVAYEISGRPGSMWHCHEEKAHEASDLYFLWQ